MKSAALISYFNDIDMLALQLRSGQLDLYDSIYIFDGPFSFTRSIDFMTIDPPKLGDSQIGREILSHPKVIYEYREWKDEREKRIAAYGNVQADIVVLHDTDEFYKFDHSRLIEFWNSEYSVAAFSCQNLYLDGIFLTNEFYNTDDLQKLPQKCFAFKKNTVSAADHLNFLWLVGVDRPEPNWKLKFPQPIATGYHFTGMRSRRGQQQKFIFYGALNQEISGNHSHGPIARLLKLVNECKLSREDALDVFLNSIPGYHRCPPPHSNLIFKHRIVVPELENILLEVLSDISWDTASGFQLVHDIPRFQIVLRADFGIPIRYKCSSTVQCDIWAINYDQCIEHINTVKESDFSLECTTFCSTDTTAILLRFQNTIQSELSTMSCISNKHAQYEN